MAKSIYFKLSTDNQFLEIIEKYSDQVSVMELYRFFERKSEKYFFDPRYKAGIWDGFVSFLKKNKLRTGLWGELLDFKENSDINIQIEGLDEFFDIDEINLDKVLSFTKELLEGTDIEELRYYQEDAILMALQYKYMCSEIATSGGKTLIAYVIFQYLKEIKKIINPDNKFLIIVPSKGLVAQTITEFDDKYNNGKFPYKWMGMGGKYKFKQKDFEEADIVVSTYQSLARKDDDFFKPFKAVIVDEAHTSINKSITTILGKCINTEYKIGMSGTLVIKEKNADFAKLQEGTGPVIHRVPANELITGGFSAEVDVNAIRLKYDHPAIDDYKSMIRMHIAAKAAQKEGNYYNLDPYNNIDDLITAIYTTEKAIIVDSQIRKKFIVDLVNGINKNTLILFNNIKDGYGKNLHQMFEDSGTEAFYIDGDVKVKHREEFQAQVEKSKMSVLLASFGTFSTGINLKNIHYLVFAESYKSPKLIRQSIGRGMRLLEEENKYKITIIDLVDNFGKYSKKHSYERKSIYLEQKFNYSAFEKILK